MSDDIPFIGFGFNGRDERVAIVGKREYEFLSDMFIDAPFLREPENIVHLAKALNHFQHGMDFNVIDDINTYVAKFRQTYAAQEDQPFDQYQSSIADFSMPNLEKIAPPVRTDDNIEFYVNHQGLGIPYRVTGAYDGQSDLKYSPL